MLELAAKRYLIANCDEMESKTAKKSDWNRMCVCSGCRNCCSGWRLMRLMRQPSVNDLAAATLIPLLADRPYSHLDLCYNLRIDNI